MKRSAPMKRSGFKRKPFKVIDVSHNLQEVNTSPERVRGVDIDRVHFGRYGSNEVHAPQPKEPDPVRSEPYRRLVAGLRCIRCHIATYSQAAHPNVGKAKGEKASDLECFPLCCARPDIEGCHYAHDQHKLFARGERGDIEAGWGASTRLALLIQAQDDPHTAKVLRSVGLLP